VNNHFVGKVAFLNLTKAEVLVIVSRLTEVQRIQMDRVNILYILYVVFRSEQAPISESTWVEKEVTGISAWIELLIRNTHKFTHRCLRVSAGDKIRRHVLARGIFLEF